MAATHLLGPCEYAASSHLTTLAARPSGAPGGSLNCLALQTAGLMFTCLSRVVQVAMASVCPLNPACLCAGGHVFRGPPVSWQTPGQGLMLLHDLCAGGQGY